MHLGTSVHRRRRGALSSCFHLPADAQCAAAATDDVARVYWLRHDSRWRRRPRGGSFVIIISNPHHAQTHIHTYTPRLRARQPSPKGIIVVIITAAVATSEIIAIIWREKNRKNKNKKKPSTPSLLAFSGFFFTVNTSLYIRKKKTLASFIFARHSLTDTQGNIIFFCGWS